MTARHRRQRGQAIVLVALMMTVLVGFVALALDSARAFDGRRILQDAVDAGALAGAEIYQNGPIGPNPNEACVTAPCWAAAETGAVHLFERDNGLAPATESCSPALGAAPTPGAPGAPVSTTCTIAGGAGYLLTISVTDNGPGGQTFGLSSQRPLSLALMQVLGQSPTVNLIAAGTATAADQARTPALAALGQGGCFGSSGTALNISAGVVSVRGDIVSNGAFSIGSLGSVNAAGDVLTRCGAPSGTGALTYQCWPGGATPPCTAPAVAGSLRSTAYRLADPNFLAPSTAGLVSQGVPGANVVLSPGIYAVNPLFGNAGSCYFLAGGVYVWQGGMTVNSGIVSNQFRPPDEPLTTSNTTRATPQFWDDAGALCSGSFSLNSGSYAGKGIGNGTWSVIVTALRTDVYNGVSYTRETAPSMCRSLPISGSDKTLIVNVNNVPGATGYNVYAQQPVGTPCAGPFGLVQVNSINNSASEIQSNLGTASGSYNSDQLTTSPAWAPNPAAAPDTFEAYPPSSETAPFNGSTTLPNSSPARGTSPQGDRAGENHCATGAGATTACPAAVTPGAVETSLINNFCLNVTANGDAFLNSGYQYDWILYYEPPATSCLNTLQGKANTAPIGMIYTPGAGFQLVGGASTETSEFGGLMAGSIQVQGGALPLYFNASYSPHPPGTRLTG